VSVPQIILVTSVDVAPGSEADFNRWYNETHLPEVLACPGFRSAARYECTQGEPRFLAVYELDDEGALQTPELKRVRGFGEMFPQVRNFHERVYRRIHQHGGR
jgi:hypothetical protein